MNGEGNYLFSLTVRTIVEWNELTGNVIIKIIVTTVTETTVTVVMSVFQSSG